MEDIDEQPYIPGYLKGTPIERLNSAYPLYLPTRFEEYWTRFDKIFCSCFGFIHVFQLTFVTAFNEGPGVDDSQAESVPTDYPIPPEVLLYYFEVDIIDKGEDGYIGVGFAKDLEILEILPGIAFECALKEDLFPIIGLRTRGECVEANFGTKPFKFDIDSYAKAFFSEPRIATQIEGPKEILMRHIDID
ncbi:2195_t:CDS:2, partial [Cetraspora pellucida]